MWAPDSAADRLLVVTDRHGSGRPLVETVRAVLDGGAGWIWFRDRDLAPAPRRELARAVLALVRDAGGRMTVGGDADLAAAIGADGVHLGGSGSADARPHPGRHPEVAASAGRDGGLRGARPGLEAFLAERVAAARRLLGAGRCVGFSAHGLADLRAAAGAGADYATLSPIFATPSKPGYGPALGLAALREAATLGLPVYALGGLGPAEAAACRQAGAAGVAVMGGLMGASDPAERTRALLAALA